MTQDANKWHKPDNDEPQRTGSEISPATMKQWIEDFRNTKSHDYGKNKLVNKICDLALEGLAARQIRWYWKIKGSWKIRCQAWTTSKINECELCSITRRRKRKRPCRCPSNIKGNAFNRYWLGGRPRFRKVAHGDNCKKKHKYITIKDY